MLARLRSRLNYANVVSTLCLVLVVGGGSAYAANTIFSTDIVDGEVKTPDLANSAVTQPKLAANSVSTGKVVDSSLAGRDVAGNSLTGADVLESSLGKVPDADALDGIDSSGFTQPACFNQSGAVKGYARIQANPDFSTTFTTVGVNFPYNCSGATVEARRVSLGTYDVRFNGNPAELALASELQADGDPTAQIATVAAGAPGTFRVEVRNHDFEPISFVDSIFVIAVFF